MSEIEFVEREYSYVLTLMARGKMFWCGGAEIIYFSLRC